MPANKSHHYVPQMYMRLFSTDGTRVGVFVIQGGRFVPKAPIRGQACRDYFYGKDPQTERAFGKVEGNAARIFAEAIEHRRLPRPGSEDHEWLIFFLGIQHCRTVAAAQQYEEGSVKALKAALRRRAELEGNEIILENIDKVVIKRTNAVSEIVAYATIGANLLNDLTYVLLVNETKLPFISSDAPVALHNRHYEGQRIGVTGYANVGLQLYLPLGGSLALLGYDASAYQVALDESGVVRLTGEADVRLFNDLQWESARAVLLLAPGTSESEVRARAEHWASLRKAERVVFSEEVVERSETQVRTRQGGGEAPSVVHLDLSFVRPLLPKPQMLANYEVPPFRDPARVVRTDLAFRAMAEMDELRRRGGSR